MKWIIACKNKATNYCIKGKLVNYCDNSSIANVDVNLSQRGAGGIITPYKKGVYLKTQSNSNGEFEIVFDVYHKSKLTFLTMQEQIPAQNLDIGSIPYSSSSLIYYRVKINNVYTNTDTLFIFDITSQNKYYKMLGPFHDTTIGLKVISSLNDLKYNAELKKVEKINSTQNIDAWYSINYKKRAINNVIFIESKNCNAIADTLTLYVN